MFSNRSVSVQPSAPPIEYAGTPEAFSVLAFGEERVPVLGGCDARVLEGGDVVPDGRLVGGLEDEAVELAVDRAELEEVLRVVGLDVRAREVDRLQRALLLELRDDAGLRDRREVGRVAALDRGAEHGRHVVAGRRVLDGHVRILALEAVQHGLEGLLLVAGPDADDRDVAGDIDDAARWSSVAAGDDAAEPLSPPPPRRRAPARSACDRGQAIRVTASSLLLHCRHPS